MYYRHQDRDLNTTHETAKQPRPKLWSEQRKWRKSGNSSLTSASTYKASIPTTQPMTTTTVTNSITKTTDELNAGSPSSSSTSAAQESPVSSTSPTANVYGQQILTTTERSFPYNVLAHKSYRPAHKSPTAYATNGHRLSNAMWGRWLKWTKCSRSCGGGVMSQSRHCLSR